MHKHYRGGYAGHRATGLIDKPLHLNQNLAC